MRTISLYKSIKRGRNPEYMLLEVEAIVDDEDYRDVSSYRWYLTKRGYPARTYYNPRTRKSEPLALHRHILKDRPGFEIDHINHNKLDNRRINLRHLTHADNMKHRKHHSHASSYYKGIWKNRHSWQAVVRCDNKKYYIGSFPTERWAALAYDIAASDLFGDLAVLNFPKRNNAIQDHSF